MRTLSISEENVAAFVENLAADVGPTQILRELTENSIDAGADKILWTTDKDYSHSGADKLSIIDNGHGMTGQEMVKYLNELASSSRKKSLTDNFGVGGTLASVKNSPFGVIYLSWKDGVGSKIHFWKDPETGQYGLKPLARLNGRMHDWSDDVFDHEKPSGIIKENGTKIILLGHDENDNTVRPAGRANNWIERELSARYFEFPDGTDVRVSHEKTNMFGRGYSVYSRHEYFEEQAVKSGVVSLKGADAHWWLLKANVKPNTPVEDKGHVGVVFQDELYDVKTGSSGNAMFKQAGIPVGGDRVVLYFVPVLEEGQQLKANIVRGALSLDSNPLPITEWATQFSDNLPDAIKSYLSKVLEQDPEQSSSKMMQSLTPLKPLLDLESAFRRNSRARTEIDPSLEDDNAIVVGQALKAKHKSSGDQPSGGKKKLKTYIDKAGSGKSPMAASKVNKLVPPDFFWVTDRADTELQDNAAKYDNERRELYINLDFKGFKSFLKMLQDQYAEDHATQEMVSNTFKFYYARALVTMIVSARGLSKSAQTLPTEFINKLTTPEALTSASLSARVDIQSNVVQSLRKKRIPRRRPKASGVDLER